MNEAPVEVVPAEAPAKQQYVRHQKRYVRHQKRCPHCGHRTGYSLTPKDVKAIRRKLAKGATLIELARRYGVTNATIYGIKVRRIWKSVT